MRIGDWDLHAVVSGMFRLDGGAMFGVVPRNLWSKAAPPDAENRISMAMRLLVARSGGKVVVVDTGAGVGYGEKLESIYSFENTLSPAAYLRGLHIAPEEVTDVILTHLHFDHAAGAAVPMPGGGWELAFPNAAHHVQRTQWDHALDPNPRDRASYFRDRIELLAKKGVLTLHDGDWKLSSGLDVLAFDGHTPGQHLPLFFGGGESVLFSADLIPTAAHFPTPYIMAYDLDPVRSMGEKTGILEQAARENWIFAFEHDPGTPACRVRREGDRVLSGDLVIF